MKSVIPSGFFKGVGKRFDKNQVILEDNKAAFDVVRAAVNLVLASMLITIGTNYKLPLSTTYVTFMVAMGSSLADKAWSRESAVFRVTGVLSVIGGWFMTAAVAFLSAAFVCIVMYYGGIVVQTAFIALVVFLLIRSSRQYKKKEEAATKDDAFRVMMRTRDPEIVWDLLRKHVTRTQSYVNRFALRILDGFENENVRTLRKSNKDLKNERDTLKKLRRQEMLGLKKSPTDIAIERNTWFHLGANSNQQFVYSLRRMLDPVLEHVENNFNPLPKQFIEEFKPVREKVNELMTMTCDVIETGHYENYREILAIRKKHIDRLQQMNDNSKLQISLVYLNVLQESQEFLSVMRHQLRAAKKFMEN